MTHTKYNMNIGTCRNCNKKMVMTRRNQIYCRSYGEGNCKDAYHNRTNPRGFALNK